MAKTDTVVYQEIVPREEGLTRQLFSTLLTARDDAAFCAEVYKTLVLLRDRDRDKRLFAEFHTSAGLVRVTVLDADPAFDADGEGLWQ